MRFGDSRENRCKWSGSLGYMRIWVYIEKSGKCKYIFCQKQHNESNHQMCESIRTTINKQGELRRLIRFRLYLNRIILLQLKGDTIQKTYESIQQGKKQDRKKPVIQIKLIWFDSLTMWFFNSWIDSKCTRHVEKWDKHLTIQFKTFWIESIY